MLLKKVEISKMRRDHRSNQVLILGKRQKLRSKLSTLQHEVSTQLYQCGETKAYWITLNNKKNKIRCQTVRDNKELNQVVLIKAKNSISLNTTPG